MAPSRRCDELSALVDYLVGIDTLRNRLVAQDQQVAQAVMYYRAHMVRRYEFLGIEPCAGARAAVEREAAARAGANLDPLAQGVAIAIRESCRIDDVDHVFLGK